MQYEGTMMNRRTYLIHCSIISLKRRIWWVVLTALTTLILGLLFNLRPEWIVISTLLVAALTAAGIAGNSWSRHSADPEARDLPGQNLTSRS